MEEQEFESNIREAFKRIKRDELRAKMNDLDDDSTSEELFENNIAEAGRRIKRDAMKAILQREENEEVTVVSSSPKWWRYAAAACVVVGLGVIILYQISTDKNLSENTISKVDTKQQTKDTVDSNINEIREDTRKISNEVIEKKQVKNEVFDFTLNIKSENLGFGTSDKLNVSIIIDKSTQGGVTYLLNDKGLTLLSADKLEIKSVVSLDDRLYLKANNNFYEVSPTDEYKPIVIISNPALLKRLDKIDFTNADK